MADDFDWAERQQFLTSFFFCLAARAFTLRRSASLSEKVSTSPAELPFFPLFFFLPLLRTMYPWEYGDGGVSAVLDKKRNAALEGRTCEKTLIHVDLGWSGATTQPCQAQSSQTVPEEHRTGRPLIVPSGFSSLSWIPFAALILRRLVCADWPL